MTGEITVQPARTNRALLAKNSFANLIRSAATSAIGVFLPIVLVLVLSGASYSVWALVFSIAAYVTYFDAGIPASMQALVSRARATGDGHRERRVAVSGLQTSSMIGGIALCAAILLALWLPVISPGMPPQHRTGAAFALVILSVGQASNLVANSAASYFSGLQRGVLPAAVIAPARIVSMIAAVALAVLTSDLVATALGFAVPLALAAVVLAVQVLRETAALRTTASATPAPDFRPADMLRYAGPLILWGICTLVATGLGTLIVARYAWHELVAFSMATVVTTAIAGIIAAAVMPLLPELSRLTTAGGGNIASQLVVAIRVNSAFLFSIGGLSLVALPWYLQIVVPAGSRVPDGWLMATALVSATLVHVAATPLSLGFVATNTHRRLIASPLAEALTSVVLALLLAPSFGSLGVAVGMLAGSFVGVMLTCFWSIRRARFPGLVPSRAANWTLFIPAVGLLPPVAALIVFGSSGVGTSTAATATGIACAAVCVAWQVGVVFPASERRRIRSSLSSKLRRR